MLARRKVREAAGAILAETAWPVDVAVYGEAAAAGDLPRYAVRLEEDAAVEEAGPLRGGVEVEATLAITALAGSADEVDDLLEQAHRRIVADGTLRGTAGSAVYAGFSLAASEEGEETIIEGTAEYSVRWRA